MESTSPVAAIEEAANHVRGCWGCAPRVGIILGSGLGGFAEQIDVETKIPYGDIPHFPRSTAVGHRGQLLCGTLAGATVIAMQGRCHAYEGYTPSQITLPVRVMHALGVELLVVSNASGGMNPHYRQGDIVVIDDHINLMFNSPLVGAHHDAWGERFPDMSSPYDRALGDRALAVARQENFAAHRGVYVGVKGPNLETRAEYRLYRRIGGDVIGMSTVPEVIVAAQLGMRVLGLATVTNVCLPDALGHATGLEIIDAAAAAEPKLRKIVTGIVAEFAGSPKSPAALAIGEA